jgi:enoyl-CoA hydratase/carnithine racemase
MAYTAPQLKGWKPMVTAVNGTTGGGGLVFVADADVVVASENASFIDAHVTSGLVARSYRCG